MAITVRDIGTEALGEIEVVGESNDPTSGQLALCLRKLNDLLDQWRAESLAIPIVTRYTVAIVANQTSYTVGTTGNIAIPRPGLAQLVKVAIVDTAPAPDLEISLGELLTEKEYQEIAQKAQTDVNPQRVYYSPTYPTGTLIPWPIPTSTTLLWAVYYRAAIQEFASINVDVDLPAGYRRMLVKNLALELCPSFGIKQPSPLLVDQARDSKAAVKRSNYRDSALVFPPDVPGTFPSRGYRIQEG